MKKGLGKGLSALFTENLSGDEAKEGELSSAKTLVRISKVGANPNQPRKKFDEEALSELSESIKQHGILSPLLVKAEENGFYTIIAGERRWRAAKMAGIKEIPVIQIECTDAEASEIALVENLQREDLNILEEAKGYRRLMEEFSLTQEDIAVRVSKSRPAVANALRLLALPEEVLKMVEENLLSGGHARSLLPLGEGAVAAAKEVTAKKLSVRETEKLVKKLQSPQDEKPQRPFAVNYIEQASKDLERSMGRKVQIKGTAKKGKIELSYHGDDDLNLLLELLQKLGR